MVSKEPFSGRKSFACEVCGHHYATSKEAKECETFCEENDACNSDFLEKALDE